MDPFDKIVTLAIFQCVLFWVSTVERDRLVFTHIRQQLACFRSLVLLSENFLLHSIFVTASIFTVKKIPRPKIRVVYPRHP